MAYKTLKLSVLSHFYIAVVLDGLQRLSGLFVLEILKSTNVTRQNAVTPFIFSWAIGNLVAAFSDVVVGHKYSDFVILLGVSLTATGSALSIFETSVTAIIVFWGFIFGSGYGLALPHLLKSLKSVESGKLSFILQTTPCLGIFIMSFVLPELTQKYGLQGSYLILSGIILHYLPLSVAAAYNISICIPNVKWRVRKKSDQYVVSKENAKIASNESFINSLEPDLILEIDSGEENQFEFSNKLNEVSTNVEYYIGRKRSETKGTDLQSLETFFPNSRTDSQVISKNIHEKGLKLLEESFCIKENSYYSTQHETSEHKNELNCNVPCVKPMEKNQLMTEKKEFNNNFKKEMLSKLDAGKLNEVTIENGVLTCDSHEKKDENNIYVQRGSLLENTFNHALNAHKNSSEHKTIENDGHKEKVSFTEKFKDDKSVSSLVCNKITVNDKVVLDLTPPTLKSKPLNIPMDIKVHVEECIFTAEDFWKEFDLDARKFSIAEYESLSSGMHDIVRSTKQTVTKDLSTASDSCKSKLANMYTISKNPELCNQKNSKENDTKQQKKTYNNKITAKLKFLYEIASPICLCITLMTVIFEINLVTLLTMFADIANYSHCSDYKWILAAFGVGGIVGRFCSFKISKVVPEKSHTVGVILFLLTGLSTAGILYSPNSYWLAGFYSILGGLEGGFTFTIPKIIHEYTDQDFHSAFSSVKNFFSGVTLICFLYAIGLFPEELEDNEFLLQTLSCSSVLCAFFAYFLPYLRISPDKKISLKDKLEHV